MGRFSRLAALTVLAGASVAPVPSLRAWGAEVEETAVATAEADAAEAGADADASVKVSAKAVKYLDVLRKRPEPGYLFDRFYNTWLDDSTAADLQQFLTAKAAESKATPDQLLLAFFFAKQGDDAQALEEFNAALAANPGSPEAHYQKAVIEARTLDFDAAIADLQKARELKPEAKLQVQVDKLLGRLLVRNRKVDDALKVWNELLAANPKDEELAEDLIELHIDEGLFEQAAKLNETLLAKTKDPYLAVTRRLRLGDIHQRGGKRPEALKAYSTALAEVGHESWLEQEILAQTEQLFRREDSLAQLKTHYDELLKEHPKRIALHRRYAQLLVQLGENEPAIAAYKQILDLTPGNRANREEYIEVLAKIGDKKKAIEELKSLCEQHKADGELKFRLATLLQEDKQTDAATAQIAEYLKASDKSEYAYLRAARQLERFERKDAAAGVYKEMAETFADSASAQEAYAAFLYATEKKEEALAIWKELAADAELSELLHVSRALATRNENEAALKLLQAREQEFAKEPLYFSQLATTALALKKPELALPWTERRVELAATTPDLESALDQAVAAADRSDKIEDSAKRLAEMKQRTIQQTCLLAELLEAAGDSDVADAALKEAAEKGDLLAVSEQIRLFSQRRDWTAAADATRKLLDLPGGRKSIYVRRLVELCQRDFQLDEALKWIDEWKRLSPGSTTPWTMEATLMMSQGKEDDAIAVLKSAVQKFDGAEDLRTRLAQLYTQTDHLADAERIYWQLYEETEDVPGKLRWTQELTKLADQQGKLTQLVEQFEERRQSNRQSIVPLLALSEVHRTADNYEGRRQALTAAAKIKPDDLELLHHIARVEEQEGDWKAAIATLERAAPLDKTNRTKERIAKLHLTFGDADDGFEILFELADAEKGDPRTLEAIADAMCGIQEWERAADFLSTRINDHQGDYRLRYLLGVACEEAGREKEAAAHFLALLGDYEELPDVAKKNTQLISQHSQFEELAKIAPRDAVEMLQATQYRYQAYMHQQNRGMGMAYSLSSGGPQMKVQVPPRVDQLRTFAIPHLVTIAKLQDEEGAAEIARSMKQQGVRGVDLLMEVDMNQGDFMAQLPTVLEENPDDETALALVVLNQFGRRNPQLDQFAPKIAEKFKESYPQLALLGAFQAGLAMEEELAVNAIADNKEPEEAVNPHFDQVLELAKSIDNPNAMTVMSVALALSGQNGNGQAATLRDKYRQPLSRRLIDWYPAVQKSSNYGPWAFIYVVGALAQGEDPTAYITFLEEELARSRKKGSAANRGPSQFSFSNQPQTLLAPIAFPPQQLTDFPSELLVVLQAPDNNNPYSSMTARADAGQFDAEKAMPLVKKVRDPILRLLLANRFEQEELADEILKEQLASKQPRLDAYLLAAGKANADEDYVRAAELLSKARYLPMQRDMRARVDAAIVAAVVAAKDEGKLKETPAAEKPAEGAAADTEESLLAAGQAACLRLRQSRLDPNRRGELIAAMENLGLEREAEKLDKLASTQPAASAPMAAIAYASTSLQASSPDRIKKLIDDGKRDAALKLLANDVLQQARQVLANPQNGSYMRQQFRQLKTRVSSLGMMKELIESLDPGDSSNPQKAIEYGVVCEMFDEPKKARATYERALEKRPKDDALRMRLAMLLVKEDAKLAEEQLKQLKPTASMVIGQSFVNQMQDYESDLEIRVACAELAAIYLKQLASEPNVQTGWSESLVQMLSQQLYTRTGRNLPSVLQTAADKSPEEAESKKEEGKLAKLIERRRAAHEAFCREMLKTENSARSGFTYLLGAKEARNEVDDEEFTKLAAKVLREEASRRPLGPQNSNYYSNNESGTVRLRSPEEYLVRRATETDWKLIDDELLPELEKGRNKRGAEELARYAKLYRCPPEEFKALAIETMKRSKPNMNMPDNAPDVAVVAAAWADRKLTDVDLLPAVVDRLERLVKSQNHHQPPSGVIEFIAATHKLRGSAATREALEAVTAVYLGPKEKREAFIAANNPQNGINFGSASGQIYVFGQMLDSLLQRPELLHTVVLHAQSLPSMGHYNNVEHYMSSGMMNLPNQPTEKLLETLQDSPWISDLDEFDPLVGGARNRGGAPSWLTHFLQTISQNKARKEELAPKFAELHAKQPTFGTGLINAYFKGEKEFADYCAADVPELRKLDEEQQSRISLTIAALLGKDVLAKDELSEQHAALRDWLRGSKQMQSKQVLAKLKKAKLLEEICPETYQTAETIGPQIVALAAVDREAAVEAFFRVLELIEDAQKRNQWHMGFGDGRTAAGYVFMGVMGQMDRASFDRFPLMAAIMLGDKKGKLEYAATSWSGGSNTLGEKFDSLVQAEGKKKLTPVEAAKQVHDDLARAMKELPGSLFADAYSGFLEQRLKKPEELQAFREWARKNSEEGEFKEMSREFCAAAYLVEAERLAKKEKNPSADAPPTDDVKYYREHYARLINDGALPLAWRLHLARLLVDHEGKRLPPDLAKLVATTYAEALKTNLPMMHDQNRTLSNWLLDVLERGQLESEAEAWREAWAQRYLRPTVAGASRYDNQNDLRDAGSLCNALKVYLAAADDNRVNQLLRKYDDALASSQQVVLLLLKAEKPELAARFLRSHWATFANEWPSQPDCAYDDALTAQVDAMLEKLQREEEKLFARALIASLPDPKPPGAAKDEEQGKKKPDAEEAKPQEPTPRDLRLIKLAEEFDAAAKGDEGLRGRTLTLLASSRVANAVLTKAVAEQFAKLTLATSFQQQDQTRWRLDVELAKRHFENQFAAGEVDDFIKTFDQLTAAIDMQQPHEAGSKADPLVQFCYEAIGAHGEKLKPEQYARLGRSLRAFLNDQEYIYFNSFPKFNALLLISHSRGGNGAELTQWYKELSNNCKSNVKNRGVDNQLWATLSKTYGKPTPENLAERLKGLEAIVPVASDLEWLNYHQQGPHHLSGFDQKSIYRHIVDSKFISRDDLIAYGTKIDPIPDRPFMVNVTLAEWLTSHQKHKESAALYDAGVAKAPESWKVRLAAWKLRSGAAWANAGDVEKAQTLAKEAESLELQPAEKERLKKLTELIKKKGGQAAEPKGEAAKEPAEPAEEKKAETAPTAEPTRPTAGLRVGPTGMVAVTPRRRGEIPGDGLKFNSSPFLVPV
ncbi:hypothetical protein PLANPX_4875 [Lacipirellula parvula]|uniref:Tetratricopeptide repeat protein n=2 Tax=Lacipirellula parvula TaxID=2650471 RepID=A0A5K7XLB3_9BACT|nr:hypothetical protein PLANPX_4875 [Lacipirellula parvula]